MTATMTDHKRSTIVITIPNIRKRKSKKLSRRKISNIVHNVVESLVAKIKGYHPIVQFSVFFGLAFGGALTSWIILDIAIFWAVFIPLFYIGTPNVALWSSVVAFAATWSAAVLVWFQYLDITFS